jgi:diketogulonate reductase-like aldo/keto reductase
MIQSLEASLERLNTDYIDLYWVHAWDPLTPIEEMMRALDDMVRAGKILYIGISDAPSWIVSQDNTLANLKGWTEFTGLQIEYSLIERTPERELLPIADALDCLEFELTSEQMQRLNEVSKIELGFPHDFLNSEMIKDIIYGGTYSLIRNTMR